MKIKLSKHPQRIANWTTLRDLGDCIPFCVCESASQIGILDELRIEVLELRPQRLLIAGRAIIRAGAITSQINQFLDLISLNWRCASCRAFFRIGTAV